METHMNTKKYIQILKFPSTNKSTKKGDTVKENLKSNKKKITNMKKGSKLIEVGKDQSKLINNKIAKSFKKIPTIKESHSMLMDQDMLDLQIKMVKVMGSVYFITLMVMLLMKDNGNMGILMEKVDFTILMS